MDIAHLSACTYPFMKEPPETAMAAIAAAGFQKIDLLGRMPHFSLDPAECDPQRLKAAAARHGLTIANLGTYVGVGFAAADPAEQEKTLQEVKRAIDLAAFFGARSIRTFRPHSEIDDPARIEHVAPWIKRAAAYAAANGVYMGFENHGGPLSGNPDNCRALCERVGSPYFGVLYDPCNLLADGTDYRTALTVMQDHIAHVHLKDGATSAEGFQRTMFGEGDIDFAWILEQLAASGYDGDIALEYELPAPPPAEGYRTWFERALAL